MKKLISGAISTLGVPFSSFKSNSVLLAIGIFSPLTWPPDHSTLAMTNFAFLVHTFHTFYSREAVYPSLVWMSGLNSRVQEIRSLEPALGYLPMWQRILNEGKVHVQQPAIDNILATGKDYLGDSSALEWNFSLTKRAKTDWCNRLQPHIVSQLMMI